MTKVHPRTELLLAGCLVRRHPAKNMGKSRQLLMMALVAMLSIACSRAQAPDAEADKPAEAAMSLDELQDRLIEYADSLKEPEEAWKERFASVFGVQLVLKDPNGEVEIARGELADGYAFRVMTMPEKDRFANGDIAVILPDNTIPAGHSSLICIWDADEFSRRLEGIGFVNRVQLEFRQGWERIHWRPIRDGGQGFGVNLWIYKYGVEEDSLKDCVYGVRFYGGNASWSK